MPQIYHTEVTDKLLYLHCFYFTVIHTPSCKTLSGFYIGTPFVSYKYDVNTLVFSHTAYLFFL